MNISTPSPNIDKPANKAPELTPMMAQYVEIKIANPDSLLFYRMGDFYELFFEDAEEASRALGITLTKRGKHQGEDIPMCGVPVHAADGYLQQLIALDFRVAVCEQLEDPAEAKKRGAKSVVKRDVVRLVTPGTLTEDNLLESGANNFLASLARTQVSEAGDYTLAWVDLSTGEFRLAATSLKNLEADIARIDPKELILSDAVFCDPEMRQIFEEIVGAVVPQPAAFFESTTADERITRFFNVASLDAFGTFSRCELAAAAAILSYIEKTQIGEKPALNPPAREDANSVMLIDPATRANLEITKTLSGEKKGGLLATVNMTVTGSGARLLAERLASPSLNAETINQRLDAVSYFLNARELRARLRNTLKAAPDILRCLSRLTLSRGGPRDMAAIGAGLEAALSLDTLLGEQALSSDYPKLIQEALNELRDAPKDLAHLLISALRDELPLLKRDGGFVAKGYDKALDETCALRDESRKVIASLQVKYSELADIKALKIKHNNVLGYFIEVTAQHSERLLAAPMSETFIHRQTLANVIRFTTTELSELQTSIVNAADRARGMELAIFDTLEDAIVSASGPIKKIARAMAELDVANANAELAERRNYCRPKVDNSLSFAVVEGRHPVVERALSQAMSDPFVANNCDLSGDNVKTGGGLIWLVTGPNMAGKSTFLRQNALIAIMAQSGGYVPATSAHIGMVDRLFSRVGAADDLARGRSTFMVEMVETAAILNQAGSRALVILDEIGRGTATFDGLSIAWAAIEHLHEVNRSRCLFATHYHELTALSEKLKRLSNATVKVSEWKGDVVFLHEIVPGAADRSYGIQVAKLAGLPATVINRAKGVLGQLEASDRQNPTTLIDDLPLFNAAKPAPPTSNAAEGALKMALDAVNPDDLTPREALEQLYALKARARDS
ncbi:MAG: DNA mismatch repair protein MutS [Hyphomicrobiales bacterium]